MVEHVKLKVSVNDDYEWLINEDTEEVIAEAQKLTAEDVLWALGYRFSIEVDPEEDYIKTHTANCKKANLAQMVERLFER